MEEKFCKSLKSGNLEAYNKLFETHYLLLFNYAYKLSNDRDISQDIVQESFIKLWIYRKNIKPHLSIGNYLLKICFNEFLIHDRKWKRENSFLYRGHIETAYEIIVSTDQKPSKIENLVEAINELSPRCKEALTLSKFDNMKHKDVAKKMGISIKTVENHISKAYNEIRNRLKS